VKQRENYYFDVAAADPGHKGLPPAPGFIDPKTGLKLAYEVGWLHLDGVTNNEAENPGLGYSIAYAAPGLKLTVFVYDRGNAVIPSELDAKIAKSEFNSAVSDMLTVIPKYLPLGPVTSTGVMLRQDFKVADQNSIVALAVSRNRFINIRLTSMADRDVLESAEESIDALMIQIQNR
jgi:hypothetical protein